MNSKIKDLWLLVGIQFLTVPLVILSFRLFEPKRLAAVVAGCFFIAAGFTMIHITRKWEEYRSHICYWLIRIHVFIFAIPMMIGRIIFWQKDFSEILYFKIPGPVFHDISEKFYLILMAGTILDLLIAYYRRAKGPKSL